MADVSKILIGAREWGSLPGLGLPLLKAKVDTGAKTSSLHAVRIEIFTERSKLHARFFVHPRRREGPAIECVAPVVDSRIVSDSGGHRERRWVIETEFAAGGFSQKIEITLANRETMSYRLLLGRSALKHFLIDPSRTFMLGKPAKTAAPHGKRTKKAKKST